MERLHMLAFLLNRLLTLPPRLNSRLQDRLCAPEAGTSGTITFVVALSLISATLV